jgi:hypothetical protein
MKKTEEDLKKLAEEVVDYIPKSKWFTNKALIAFIVLATPIVFSAGAFWNPYADTPQTTHEQWRLEQVEKDITEIKGELKDIKNLLLTMRNYTAP